MKINTTLSDTGTEEVEIKKIKHMPNYLSIRVKYSVGKMKAKSVPITDIIKLIK